MRAVFFHQGALGDFLLALSAFEGWCEPRSGLSVDFWSKREHVALLSGKEYLGDSHSLEGLLIPSLLDDSLWEEVSLPDFLLHADQVFIFGQDGSRVIAERLQARTGAKVDWLRSFPAPDDGETHVLDFIHNQLERLRPPCQKKSAIMRITPPHSATAAAKRLFEGLGLKGAGPILVHPGSGGAKKVWPLNNWQNLLRWIEKELSVPVILSRGPADDRLGDFYRWMSTKGRPVISGLPMVELAAVLSLCRAYIGCDSGVSHLAAASGTPSLVIFGPTEPGVWGPRAARVHLVKRSWGEADIFDWRGEGELGEPDGDIARILSDLLAG